MRVVLTFADVALRRTAALVAVCFFFCKKFHQRVTTFSFSCSNVSKHFCEM
jgi:hypothetical protein